MGSAESAVRELLLRLASPQFLAQALAILIALAVGFAAARAARSWQAAQEADAPARSTWPGRLLAALLALVPLLAMLATLLAGRAVLAAAGLPTGVTDSAVELLAALLVVRLGVYVLGRLLGPDSWVRSRQVAITLVLGFIVALALLGWLDGIESALSRVSLVPGRSQFSLWALLKGLVVVTAFVVVASLIAGATERYLMRLEQVAVSTRVGVSKFTLIPADRPRAAARDQRRGRRHHDAQRAVRRRGPGSRPRPAGGRQQFRQRFRAADGQVHQAR